MLMIRSENICFTKIFVIIRVKPNIIETQKTLTNLYSVKRPKTPYFVLKENQLPPKKYPKVTKLKVRKILQMKRNVNCGIGGGE